MPPQVRVGDISTGDPCGAPPRPVAAGSPNVTADGIPVARVGDPYIPHSCPGAPPHGAVAAVGSSKVTHNGLAAHRVGDPISCGSAAATGSPKVMID